MKDDAHENSLILLGFPSGGNKRTRAVHVCKRSRFPLSFNSQGKSDNLGSYFNPIGCKYVWGRCATAVIRFVNINECN